MPSLLRQILLGGQLEERKRWWTATAWLWLLILSNVLVAALLLIAFKRNLPVAPTPVQLYALLASVAQIACIAATLEWYRWGWWGLVSIGLISLCVNLAVGVGLGMSLIGLPIFILTFLILKGGGKARCGRKCDSSPSNAHSSPTKMVQTLVTASSPIDS